MPTTLEGQNTQVVRDAYAAFSRGDIQSVLDALSDTIVWRGVIGAAGHVPMSGVRRGKGQVADFFKSVAQTLQFSRFEPNEFIAQGDKVVTLGHYAATTTGGGSFDSDFVMVFTLRDGKIAEFQEFLDAPALNAAFRS